MDKIEKLEELKAEVNALQRDHSMTRENLTLKLGVMVDSFFEGKQRYHNVIHSSNLYFSGINSKGNEARKEEMWYKGKDILLGLMDTLIYQLDISEGFRDQSITVQSSRNDRTKVFIVHGHDDGAKNEAARFVEKLGFEAKILHEQVDSGATIIEKLEKYTDVGFAIVLYTECDIGGVKSNPEDLKPRARQNVIFEHGLLIGKIGRANVVALVKGDVEIPNDISGVVYKSMDTGGAWKYSIAREMKSSGYDVDMNKID